MGDISREAIQQTADEYAKYWAIPVREHFSLSRDLAAEYELTPSQTHFLSELVRHGCPVGPKVLDQIYGQSNEGLAMAQDSYFTKNRVFEDIFDMALKSENYNLLTEMVSEREVEFGAIGIAELTRPEVLGSGENEASKRLVGIEKPEIYLVTQAFKNADAIYLTKDDLEISREERDKYQLWLSSFGDIIGESADLTSMTTDVAVRMCEILHSRGVSNQNIAEFLAKGFSPYGPLSEHGEVGVVVRLVRSIYREISLNSNIDLIERLDIGNQLKEMIQVKVDKYIHELAQFEEI